MNTASMQASSHQCHFLSRPNIYLALYIQQYVHFNENIKIRNHWTDTKAAI